MNAHNQLLNLRGWLSQVVLVLFLALGFCPLRNALVSCAVHHPVKSSHSRTALVQEVGNDGCNQGRESILTVSFHQNQSTVPPMVMPAIIVAAVISSFWIKLHTVHITDVAYSHSKIPLYLKNRVFLI